MRKSTLRVGDKVNHIDYPEVDGVIVFQLDQQNPFNKEGFEWNVHFNINTSIGDRKFCKSDELIKAKPKLGLTKKDVLEVQSNELEETES